ncbi:amidohydrolase family protein [Wenzhouxiangella marina]|uniref:Imidazolonepropionase related amidohydrolase n=1 Tax=Wenzhouxiangella marina TaxID=1579979 RepID=A0A0K0XVQ1_9GAMM|nr:amidohydrolase family protein [Wenzhouxiangella marina]AKS41750.1 Imidazolonepropionase related amidohydrolase [Wenzhouxiangella marina]MBB6086488.1 Tol biopolymer transport system component/imidazolonepropionase-like amidohydrolase [Wenzhouxiangella marina]
MKNSTLTFLLFLLLNFAWAPLAFAQEEDVEPSEVEQEADDPREDWSVNEPPGEWQTIAIDTETVTWADVDVSPDGQTLVFHMLGDIYTVGIEGGEARALTEDIAWSFQPRFSPSGEEIAFISDRGGAENIWIMKADGSDPVQVTSETEHLLHNPAWSPDGQYIAARKGYVSTRSIPAGSIWMYHRSGGSGVELVARTHGDQSQKNIAEPFFSPDGEYVYFSQDVTPERVWAYNRDANQGIFAVRRLELASGEVETVTGGPGGAIRPVLSPDGKQLAFVRRNPTELSSRLMVRDLDSGIEHTLFDRLERDKQETSGDMGNYPAFAWHPDGGSIVIWAGGGFHRIGTDGSHQEIPVRIRTQREIRPALQRSVEVSPDEFPIRMARWTQSSPDGRWAIYQALGYLWLHDLEDGGHRRLTRQNEHWEFYPRFSPDSRWVVYTTFDDQDLGSVRIAPVGRGRGRVLSSEPGHYVEPSFSPDGEHVVYRKTSGGYLTSPNWSERTGLYRVALDGGEPVFVTDSGSDPQFSADGERILFSQRLDGTRMALNSVDLNGQDAREHLVGAWITEYEVSSDGRWVAFAEHYKAYVAPFFATGQVVNLSSGTKAFPVRQVSARAGADLHFTNDNHTLAWSHGATLYRRDLSDAFAFLADAPEELPEPVTEGLDLSIMVESDRHDGRIALSNGRIVTMRDAQNQQEVIENGVVLVEGHRIVAVGAMGDIEIPDGYQVFDLEGKTVVPGLFDSHAHGAMSNQQLTPQQNWMQIANLAFGVTASHDPSNDNAAIFSMAELQRAGQVLAPRLYSTGRILYGALAAGATARIDSYDDALFHVQRQKDLGAISVKSYNYLRRDQRQQVIEAGHELDIMVVPEGGMRFEQNMSQIADGHTGIEHSLSVHRIYDDVQQFWGQTEVVWSPTFGVAYGGMMGEEYWYDKTEVWKNEHLLNFVPRSVVYPRSIRRPTAPENLYNHIAVAEATHQMNQRGIPVVIGAHGQLAGLAAHWEMWMMVQGGFSPWEALRGATIDGATYFGMEADIGSIEAGKLADIVVIDGDVLNDIRQSERVVYTMQNGRLYDSSTMNQIAPEQVELEPFFFETEGGDAWNQETMQYFHELGHVLGWYCRG